MSPTHVLDTIFPSFLITAIFPRTTHDMQDNYD